MQKTSLLYRLTWVVPDSTHLLVDGRITRILGKGKSPKSWLSCQRLRAGFRKRVIGAILLLPGQPGEQAAALFGPEYSCSWRALRRHRSFASSSTATERPLLLWRQSRRTPKNLGALPPVVECSGHALLSGGQFRPRYLERSDDRTLPGDCRDGHHSCGFLPPPPRFLPVLVLAPQVLTKPFQRQDSPNSRRSIKSASRFQLGGI